MVPEPLRPPETRGFLGPWSCAPVEHKAKQRHMTPFVRKIAGRSCARRGGRVGKCGSGGGLKVRHAPPHTAGTNRGLVRTRGVWESNGGHTQSWRGSTRVRGIARCRALLWVVEAGGWVGGGGHTKLGPLRPPRWS